MVRHVRAPKTIAEQGGLETYLSVTSEKHNGLAYKDLMIRIRPTRKHPIPKTVIAEDFGVSTHTIYAWLRVYANEQLDKAETSPSPEDQ